MKVGTLKRFILVVASCYIFLNGYTDVAIISSIMHRQLNSCSVLLFNVKGRFLSLTRADKSEESVGHALDKLCVKLSPYWRL